MFQNEHKKFQEQGVDLAQSIRECLIQWARRNGPDVAPVAVIIVLAEQLANMLTPGSDVMQGIVFDILKAKIGGRENDFNERVSALIKLSSEHYKGSRCNRPGDSNE